MPNKPPIVGSRTTRRVPWDHGGRGRIERGYDHRWMKLRLVVLARDQHLCQPCRRARRVSPATAVDHIIPKAKGGTDDLANLEAICDPAIGTRTSGTKVNECGRASLRMAGQSSDKPTQEIATREKVRSPA
jgi:5-methylcytosine-specific restriction enzyme A